MFNIHKHKYVSTGLPYLDVHIVEYSQNGLEKHEFRLKLSVDHVNNNQRKSDKNTCKRPVLRMIIGKHEEPISVSFQMSPTFEIRERPIVH